MFLGLKQDFAPNSATPIPQLDGLWSVANFDSSYYLLSNVCPHQNSRVSQCATNSLRCPYHGFTFDLHGSGINNNKNLESRPCYSVGSMLFDLPVNTDFPVPTEQFELVEYRRDIVNATVECIMDVFVDIDHIPIAHEGVYDRIGIFDAQCLTYRTFQGGSIQLVPLQSTKHIIENDKLLELGACWLALYPGTMIEWQPGAMFITVATDHGVDIYKYRDRRYDNAAWELNQEVWEAAWSQDKQLSENIVSMAQQNLDSLKQHHRQWYAV